MTEAELIARLWPRPGFGPKNLQELVVYIEAERECESELRSNLRDRVTELEKVLTSVRARFNVEYSHEGNVVAVGYGSDALRPLITELDTALAGRRTN